MLLRNWLERLTHRLVAKPSRSKPPRRSMEHLETRSLMSVSPGGVTPSGATFAATEAATFSGTVASFTSQEANPQSAGDYSAKIDWGDGEKSTGTIVASGGGFNVIGDHTFADDGRDNVTVVIKDAINTHRYTATSRADVAEVPLTLTAQAIEATEGTSFSGSLATLTDPGTSGDPNEYWAAIDWGDGHTSLASLTHTGGANFDVSGHHTYTEEGTFTARVIAAEIGPSSPQVSATADVTVDDGDNFAPLSVTISPAEGHAFSGPVAAFLPLNPSAKSSDFLVSIDWGDGQTTGGSIDVIHHDWWSVVGGHTYGDEGTYSVVVTIAEDDPGGASFTSTNVARVSDADVLFGTGQTLNATEGSVFTGAVATFVNTGYAANPATDFNATIDWGDGTVDAGTVGGTGGNYTVSGSHSYLEEGNYAPLVTLSDELPGTASATASSTMTVADAALSASGTTLAATEGQAFAQVIASFTDADPAGDVSDYTAMIDWGDGVTDTGTVAVASDGSGGFQVSGTHTYAEEGTNSVTVSIADLGGSTATASSTVNVTDAALSASGTSVTAIEGQLLAGVVVASFTDADPAGDVKDYTATIDWGDGTTDAGAVSSNGSGGFQVSGTHAYAEEGINPITVTIADLGGSTATIASTANVIDAALSASGTTIAAIEGQSLAGVVVSNFTDADPAGKAGDYTALIDWGDGTTDAGTIASNGSGGFQVSGIHTYAEEGTNPVTVSIADLGGSTATASSTVIVADAALSAKGTSIAATEGQALSGVVVANFTDANPAGAAGDYTAMIDWGDGTTDAGTIASNGSGGFQVSGTHTYAEEGANSISVAITDAGGSSATASSSANVTEADAFVPATPLTLTAIEGAAVSGNVAVFADAGYPTNDPADFTANIDWGDGTTDAGTVATAGDGSFTVSGSHTYADDGAYAITTAIADKVPGTAVGTTTAVANIAEADLTLTPSVATFTATEGSIVSGVVATISDPGSNDPATNYSATIDWGDGTVSNGTVAGTAGSYTVIGDHVYADEGDYTVSVVASETSAVPVASATATLLATVVDADVLVGAGMSLTATEGTAFSGAVATFANTGYAGNPASDFTAMIDWGDGTIDAGTVGGTPGSYTVTGSHTYLDEGAYAPLVTLSEDTPGNASASASSTIAVAEGDSGTLQAATISATEGLAFSGAVAGFTDGFLGQVADDFTSSINWGDGTTTTGTVTGGNGSFTISGSHTYADEGTFSIAASFSDDPPSTLTNLTINSTAIVADADVLAGAGMSLTATEGASFSGTVATFANTGYAGNLPDDFTAQIDWGDGTVGSGTVMGTAGDYTVSGSHSYLEEGTYAPLVTLSDEAPGNATATASSTMIVADAALSAKGTSIAAIEGQAFTGMVVASFTDADPLGTATDYTATIDWGDGTSADTGTVSVNGSGFQVSGSHTYAEEGTGSVTVTITDAGGSTATANSSATVIDAAVSATGTTLAATEGQAFTGMVVASFTDADPLGTATDYTATIDWGDGTTDTGSVASDGSGGFQVSGTHTYAEEGTNSVTVSIADLGGSTATASSTVNVADAAVSATGTTLAATEGQAFTGMVVASFTDADPLGTATDYTATIDWGDGTTNTGSVASDGSGGFQVSGTHTYAEEGTNSVTVSIADLGGSTATASSTVNVADAALAATGTSIAATEGQAFTGVVVASFTDADPAGDIGDYTAMIDWGDGTSDTGTVASDGGSGFQVTGTHTYAEEGTNPVTVTISDVGGSTATAGSTVNVADAALLASGTTLAATEGQALTGVVASFTDADLAGAVSDYTATIDWGDGTIDTGAVASDGGSGFQVTGTHTYAEEGTNPVTVTISDVGGSTATANSTATISDATLSATSAPVAATQGQAFTGLVASFTDANPLGAVADYTATIDWGDGTAGTGVVSKNGSGGFNVSGTHTYAAIGASPVIVTINDVGGESATATSSAAVSSALVSVSSNSPIVGGGVTLNGNEYTALSNVTVATFSHDGGADPVGNFTANIDWGDGTSSAGAVSLSGGTYTVTGSHNYTDEGTFAVTVNVDDVPDNVSVAINSSAVMAEELLPGGGTGTANERFVNELYREYLGRAVDASALAFWTAELNAGVTRVTVASQLVAAADAGELRNQIIDHAFQTFLHRSADTGALAFFGQLLATGGTTEQLTQIILSSTEYFDVRGGGTIDGFLGAVYQDLLDRPIDSATRSGFEQVMTLGVTRTQVIATVMQSAEYDHIVVQQLFTAYLHRSADAGAQSAFSAQLAAGVSEVQVIGEILGSNEFFSQVS
jgi:hypothetical protein